VGKQRNPMAVGMIYVVTELGGGHSDSRTLVGDYVIPLAHTGDCHYTWARLVETSGNDSTRYFDIDIVYSAYIIEGVPLLQEKLTLPQMFNLVLTANTPGTAGVLINRHPTDQAELSDCAVCGAARSKKVVHDSMWPVQCDADQYYRDLLLKQTNNNLL